MLNLRVRRARPPPAEVEGWAAAHLGMELGLCTKAVAFLVPSILPCNWAATRTTTAVVVVPVNVVVGGAKRRRSLAVCAATARFGGLKSGAGVMEKPLFDLSQFEYFGPQAEEGGDIGWVKDIKGASCGDSGDKYRVLLIDNTSHTENLVAKVVPEAVPSVSPDEAIKKFHESRKQGVAVVIVDWKEHAEFYAHMLVSGGVTSAIEPDSR